MRWIDKLLLSLSPSPRPAGVGMEEESQKDKVGTSGRDPISRRESLEVPMKSDCVRGGRKSSDCATFARARKASSSVDAGDEFLTNKLKKKKLQLARAERRTGGVHLSKARRVSDDNGKKGNPLCVLLESSFGLV